jgi:two-component system sensor histidine kinase VicK
MKAQVEAGLRSGCTTGIIHGAYPASFRQLNLSWQKATALDHDQINLIRTTQGARANNFRRFILFGLSTFYIKKTRKPMPPSTIDPAILQFLTDNSDRGIFIYELVTHQFIYVNPAFEAAFRLAGTSALQPEAMLEMVHEEDRPYIKETCQAFLKNKKNDPIEFRALLPGQAERWLCLTPYLCEEAAAKPYVKPYITAFVEDITASKQYNDYLKKFANKKNSVLHILAHDLSGPLGMIQSMSRILAEETRTYGNETIDRFIELIEKTSSHGVSLIKDFLDQEFLETTEVNLIRRRVNLTERLKEIIDQYRQSEQKIEKTFLFYPDSSEIYAEVDDIKLIQAINNLISNAIKFTPAGGIIILRLAEKENTVLITVEDNGVGIPRKYHATLFDKFTRARRPGLAGEPSTGLGMSIIKTIVEWHRGKYGLRARKIKALYFILKFPGNDFLYRVE